MTLDLQVGDICIEREFKRDRGSKGVPLPWLSRYMIITGFGQDGVGGCFSFWALQPHEFYGSFREGSPLHENLEAVPFSEIEEHVNPRRIREGDLLSCNGELQLITSDLCFCSEAKRMPHFHSSPGFYVGRPGEMSGIFWARSPSGTNDFWYHESEIVARAA